MYKVIGDLRSRALRVLWMLEELGEPFEHIKAAPRSAEALEYNPSGKIPALVTEETTLLDSVAIVQFLADRHGTLTFPAGTIERAQQDGWTQFALDEFDALLWTASRNTFVLPKERRVPEIKETLKWEYERSLTTLERRLGANEFLMGDTMTVPDIILTHCGGWARSAGFPSPTGVVRDYFKRMTARPAYRRTLKH